MLAVNKHEDRRSIQGHRERAMPSWCTERLFQKALPWLRRLAAGLPPRRPGFDPGSVHVGFVVDKVALGQGFPPSSLAFLCQFHSTGAPLLGKGQKIIFIFIIGLHNKPHGCSASVASAAGPFTTKKKEGCTSSACTGGSASETPRPSQDLLAGSVNAFHLCVVVRYCI
jgi:hypothetical protein